MKKLCLKGRKNMNKDSILNTLIIVLALILAIVLAFNYVNPPDKYNPEISGGISVGNDKSQHVASTKTNKSNISIEPINISLATDEDMRLISLIKESDNILKNDLLSVSKAARNNDRRSVGTYGIAIQQDSRQYLDRLNNVSISPPFKILFDEYRYMLENYSKAGKHIEMGSINLGDLKISISYLKEGVVHMNNVYNLIGLKEGERNGVQK